MTEESGPFNAVHAVTDPNQTWTWSRLWTRGLWMGYVERENIFQNGNVVAVASDH